MFASPVARSQTKAAAGPAGRQAGVRAAPVVQRSLGNQAVLRRHAQTQARGEAVASQVSRAPTQVQRLGANPGCSAADTKTVHQGIFDARGWLNTATPKLSATPLTATVLGSLRRNFGPTYGVAANAPLIQQRLKVAYQELSNNPFGCATAATDPVCAAGNCGDSVAGSHASTICSNVTLTPGSDPVFIAGCVLHESFHAGFGNFTVDQYSGWHGKAQGMPTYPGTGTDPLLNADSYTTLAMDLS